MTPWIRRGLQHMLEKDLQKKCLDYVNNLRRKGEPIVAINQHGSAFSNRGVSDLILCIKGKFVAIELKVGTNQPTDLQTHFLNKVLNARGMAYVIYTLGEFERAIDRELED